MNVFENIKQMLSRTFRSHDLPQENAGGVIDAVEAADCWDQLDRILEDLRSRNRRRQLEIIDRLTPIAHGAEEYMKKAKQAALKPVKESYLRMADDYLNALDAESQASEIYYAASKMITRMMEKVNEGRAMSEQQLTPEDVDALVEKFDEASAEYSETYNAVYNDFSTVSPPKSEALETSDLEDRLYAVYEPQTQPAAATPHEQASEERLNQLEERLRASL